MDLKPDDVNEVAYVFGRLREFVARLKKLGVYDNSLLLIISDHGYNILEKMKKLPDAADYFLTQFGERMYVGQYQPLIIVKKPGAHGRLTYDDSAVTSKEPLKGIRLAGIGNPHGWLQFPGGRDRQPESDRAGDQFVGARFDHSKDFLNLENWRRDTLQMPF